MEDFHFRPKKGVQGRGHWAFGYLVRHNSILSHYSRDGYAFLNFAICSLGKMESMKAITIESPGNMGLTHLSTPSLGPEDVLLRVTVIGFCGSDLNSYRGLNPLVVYPRVP